VIQLLANEAELGGDCPPYFLGSRTDASNDIHVTHQSVPQVSPLKWAGGKRWLTAKIRQILPTKFDWYIEPFAGGASTFFALSPNRAILSDLNGELITTYGAIKDSANEVWKILRVHEKNHSNEYYYVVRDMRPMAKTAVAARFLYLNRSCWNGLYRVNLRGIFNVPRGTKNEIVLSSDNPGRLSTSLSRAELLWADFEMSIDCAGFGDVVYADPPYTVKHNFNGFVKYNESIFSWDDQERLARSLRRARKRGALVIVSNADHESVRSLYQSDFDLKVVTRASVIAGNARSRAPTTELLIVGTPKRGAAITVNSKV
jgi:DNA adenine methylase